MTLDTLPGL